MNLEKLRARKGFICDMDGVIYLGSQLLPGVREFVSWLNENDKQFLFLTNSSERSPKELRQKLQRMGLDIGGGAFLHQRAGHRRVSCQAGAGLHRVRDRRAGASERAV